MYTILGAGLSGISSSFHLSHNNCKVFEKKNHLGGHIYTEIIDGFTWDEGPHVSFTKNEYVKQLFAENINQQYLEYPVITANYYKGNWIPHPAQSNMYAIPQPLRDSCLNDFIESRNKEYKNYKPDNYAEWLKAAFGQIFYQEFPRAYTQKYWTVEPEKLTTDWVGERVFFPNIDEVKAGYIKPLNKQTHYISKVRYPKNGGYFSFVDKIKDGINVEYEKELSFISFKEKSILFTDNSKVVFEKLVVTIPLQELISKSDAPENIKSAAKRLSCSSVLLVNITTDHPTLLDYNWMYVYDEDKFSTRINCTELLSPNNAPLGKSGIQVEVYFSKYKPIEETFQSIAEKVCLEMIELGLIKNETSITGYHTKWVEWANVIFDHERIQALDEILQFLSLFGLERNDQDLLPMTDWNNYNSTNKGTLFLAGRFAEWKYYWTDDCLLRGKMLRNM